jgi:hypothetical protein
MSMRCSSWPEPAANGATILGGDRVDREGRSGPACSVSARRSEDERRVRLPVALASGGALGRVMVATAGRPSDVRDEGRAAAGTARGSRLAIWEHRDEPNVRVVDCATSDANKRAHIPAAVRIPGHPWLKTEPDPVTHLNEPLATPPSFEGASPVPLSSARKRPDTRRSCVS